LTSDIFHRQNGLIQLAAIRRFLGLGCLRNGTELNKGIIALHVNAHQFAKWFKEHLQIFASRRFFMKVDHKESIGRFNVFAPFIFFALDLAISTSKFGTQRVGNMWNIPVSSSILVCRRKGGIKGGEKNGEERGQC
jgi:hypothetical protein